MAEPGDPEIADLDRAVGGPDDVRRFQITVHDGLFMGVGQRGRDLFGDLDDVRDGQRLTAVVVHQLTEVTAAEQLHHDEERAVVLAEVMDDGDTAVLERGRDPGLTAETFAQHLEERRFVPWPQWFEAFDRDL